MALCLAPAGCGVRGWGREGLGAGGAGNGAEGVDVDYARKWAPSIGQHSDDVLCKAGYSADEIGRLRKTGVVA